MELGHPCDPSCHRRCQIAQASDERKRADTLLTAAAARASLHGPPGFKYSLDSAANTALSDRVAVSHPKFH
jgi:hypothetical protein